MSQNKLDKLEAKLLELFQQEDAFVVALNGEWGVGKTRFWDNLTETHLAEKTVVYVSLFGKETIKEILTSIMIQVSKHTKWAEEFRETFGTTKAFGIELASMFSIGKKRDFKDIIICFDDFERSSDKLNDKDILGLISEIKEQKNCKVVMIYNQDQVTSEALSSYKDKIIDYEFEYSPTPEQSYALIENSLTVFKKYPQKYFKKNNINNIRVMKRVINSLNDFSFISELVKEHRDIERVIAENIIEISTINAMFMFKKFKKLSKYSQDKSFSSSSYQSSNNFKENKKFNKILSYIEFGTMGIFYPSDITEHIIEYTKSSIVYKKPLIKMVETRIAQLDRAFILNKIRAIYDKFNFNMGYTNLEFTNDLFEIFQTNSNEIISIIEINNFIFYINLLKELDKQNEEKYHKFAVELFINYLPIFLQSDERYHSWGEDKINNIREFDEALDKFIDEYKVDTKEKEIDTIDKVIELIKKPVQSNGWGEEPQLLMMVLDETYEQYILESQEFVEVCFDLIQYFGKSSNSGFELFINRIIKLFEKLQNSGNENYQVKMTKMLNYINEKK